MDEFIHRFSNIVSRYKNRESMDDVLSMCFGKDFIIEPEYNDKMEVMRKHMHPISYKFKRNILHVTNLHCHPDKNNVTTYVHDLESQRTLVIHASVDHVYIRNLLHYKYVNNAVENIHNMHNVTLKQLLFESEKEAYNPLLHDSIHHEIDDTIERFSKQITIPHSLWWSFFMAISVSFTINITACVVASLVICH